MNDSSSLPLLNPRTLTPSLNPTLVVDGSGLEKLRDYLSRVSIFAHDYETNVTKTFFRRRVRTLQIGDRNEQYIIDFLAFAETPEALYNAQGGYRRDLDAKHAQLLQPIIDVVGPSLQSNSHLKIGQNLEFEYIASKWCLGLRCWHYYCTMIAERVLTNGRVNAMAAGHFALDDLVRKYCRFVISKELQTTFNLEDPLTEDQIIYCALDCRLPFSIKSAQDALIDRDGLRRVIQIEMDAIPAFGDMHLNGMWVNPENWAAIIEKNKEKLKKALADLDEHFIPVVGRKPHFDPNELSRLSAQMDALQAELALLKEKTTEELDLSQQIRALTSKKADLELKAELKQRRDAIQVAQKSRIAEKEAEIAALKPLYKKAQSGHTKKAQEVRESMKGEAAINYGSTDQLLAALHKGPWGLTEKNLPSTNEKKMIKVGHLPVVKAITEFRSLEKLLSTYGEDWIKTRDEGGFVDPDTGRIHSRFFQLGADTGRASSTSPNVFNLPKDDEIRGSFQSRPGYVMVCKDCAGQELRILVEYSQEPSWLTAFRKKQDVHSISGEMLSENDWRKAALVSEKQIIKDGKVTVLPPCAYYTPDEKGRVKMKCKCPEHKDLRDKLKNINFGVIYDKQAYSTSLELGITKQEAEILLRRWHTTFKITSSKLNELREDGYTNGEARDLAGRRRFVNKVTYEQAEKASVLKHKGKATQDDAIKMYHSLIAAVKREAGNLPIQGTAASQMKLAMGCGFDKNGKPYLWHVLEPEYGAMLESFVYDEFLAESPEEHGEAVSAAISDAIIRSGAEFVKSVPMESEGGVHKCWKK